jgi:N6-adenosine-specific RNA methylase IME4
MAAGKDRQLISIMEGIMAKAKKAAKKTAKTASVKPRARRRTGWAKQSAAAAVNRASRKLPSVIDSRKAMPAPAIDDVLPEVRLPGHHRDQPTRKPSQIKVALRHRKDFGDLASLARSIDARGGLLQPIVITKDDKLIAGERRLRAWGMSQFKGLPIPVHIVDIDSLVAGEWDENAQRKDFTPSEAVAIKRALEPVERAKARERERSGVKSPDAGRAADKVAEFLGRDRKTIAKAEEVVAAAEKNPKKFGHLVDQMDKTGKVSGAHKRLQILQQTAAIRKSKPGVPMQGPYGAVIIDWPWWSDGDDVSQDEIDAAGRSLRPYPAMSFAACKAFMREQIVPILADDCVVGMCVTNYHMPYVFELLKIAFNREAEGKPPHSTILTWNKIKIARGTVLREVTEHVVIAVRGKVTINLSNETTLLDEARRENSRKPDGLYALFEKVFPATRYADIFSRGGRGKRWDCHGDQIGKFPPSIVEAATQAAIADAKAPPVESNPERDLFFSLDLVAGGHAVLGDKANRAQLVKAGFIFGGKGAQGWSLTKAGKERLAELRPAHDPNFDPLHADSEPVQTDLEDAIAAQAPAAEEQPAEQQAAA